MHQEKLVSPILRRCICEPIPEIADAARYLDAAVSAHKHGNPSLAVELIHAADIDVIRGWLKVIWGDSSKHVQRSAVTPTIPEDQRHKQRMPTKAEKEQIHERDGYNCRFCGMPVIRRETRARIHKAYPDAAYWGSKEIEQHAAFQAMWAQYDHVVPHAHGGASTLDNMLLTCATCNFGRGSYTLEDMALIDPRATTPIRTGWDGLERFP